MIFNKFSTLGYNIKNEKWGKMRQNKIFYRIFLSIFLLSSLLMLISMTSRTVAKIVNDTLSLWVRVLLAGLSSLFPFSLFELIAVTSPVWIILLVCLTVGRSKNIRATFLKFLTTIIIAPSLFFLTVGIPSQANPIISVGNSAPKSDELTRTAEILIGEVCTLSPESDKSLSIVKLRDALNTAYSEISDEFGLVANRLPRAKSLLLPKLANRLGILGHYSFLTGEVNINTDIPSYMLPFTWAHEYAHYLGVTGEAEASLLAYAACSASESAYIRYSGALSALEYIFTDLYSCNGEEYARLYKTLPEAAVADLKESYEYTLKYSSGLVYRAADEINSSYISALDKNGSFSYSAFSRIVTHYLLYS